MLSVIISFAFLSIISYSFGKLAPLHKSEKTLSLILIKGLFILCLISWICSFFLPLNTYFEIGIFIIGIGNILLHYKNYFQDFKRKTFYTNKIFIFLTILIVLTTSFYPYINDHFGYYIPTLKWLNEYGLVKGISNIHLVLGQQSPWHILDAGLDSFIDPYHRINGFLTLIFLLYCIEKKQYLILLFLPLFFLFLQSPSPDLPIYILSLIIMNEIFVEKSNSFSFLFVLSIWMFTIKPLAFWMPIFIVIFYFLKYKQLSFFTTQLFFFSLIMIGLFFLKNYLCTSNPLFPLAFSYMKTDWCPPIEIILNSAQNAVLKTYDYQYKIKEIQHFSLFEKMYHFIFLKGFKGFLHIIFIIITLLFGLIIIFKKNKIYGLLFLLGLIKISLVIVFSGQYRFFLDVIIVFIFLIIWELKSFFQLYLKTIIILISCFVSLIFMQPHVLQKNIPSFKLGSLIHPPTIQQIYIPGIYHTTNISKNKLGNLVFTIPNYHLLLDAKLPSITKNSMKEYYKIGYFPQLCGTKIKDGFYMKKLNEKEKKNLLLILNQ